MSSKLVYENYSAYLTEKQFKKICKYWEKIKSLEKKLSQLNDRINYDDYDWYFVYDLRQEMDILTDQKFYLKTSYDEYLRSIGLCANNRNQDEILFNLLYSGEPPN